MSAWKSWLLSLVLLAAPTLACGQPAAQTYGQLCAGCHGAEARGGQGPSLTDPVWMHGSTDEEVARSIRNGYPPSMPAFGAALSEPAIQALVAYLRETRIAKPMASNTGLPEAYDRTGVPKGVVRTERESFRVETIAHVDTPYGFTFLSDGRILVTEVAGRLRIIENGKLRREPVAGAPSGVLQGLPGFNKRSMLDVMAHPDNKTNGWVYLVTQRPDPKPDVTGQITNITTIHRGRIRDNAWVDDEVVLELSTQSSNAQRMAFDSQNRLYFGTPESRRDHPVAREKSWAQDISSPWGKILRMTDDGKPAPGNPFLDRKDAYPYVWSYGHREPLTLAFDNKGELWESEDGPRGGDELNHIRPGRNYGWPTVTWGHPYDSRLQASNPEQPGVEQPVASFVPSPALSVLTFYEADAFPGWKGAALLGTMKQMELYRVVLDGDRVVLRETVLRGVDRLRDINVGPDGFVYLLTDTGLLIRLVPAK